MESITQRIKHLIKINNLSVATFEKNIGAGNNSIGTAINKNSNISGAILNKILIRYTDVSPDWLITGTGEMFRNTDEKPATFKITKNPEIEKFLNLKNVFSEIFERLEKLEQNTDGLAIGHTVNQEIAKIIDEKIIEKK